MKKQMPRRILAALLMLTMLAALMPAAAFAAERGTYHTVPYSYETQGYQFDKISHPNNPLSTPDGLIDYVGNGAGAVTGTAEGANGQGDRGESYSWSAIAYGDYVYVGTCYAAMGQTLSAMDTIMGHDFDEAQMRAELNALFNGTFYYGEEDGGQTKGVLVKVNVHTGEMTQIMGNSFNGYAPQFRNAIEYHGKLYFLGAVSANGRVGLPSVYEVDPADDSFQCVYQGLSSLQEYGMAYAKGVSTAVRGIAVYEDKLVISNVGVDGGYILISEDPENGFIEIANQQDLFNYPAIHYVDSVYGGGIWEIAEYEGSLYVAMCTGTPATRVGDNMRSFAIVRGDCSGDWNDPDAWTWTPVVGDKADGAKFTFGIDPARTRAAACNMCIYDGYLYIGEYNDEEIPLEELIFDESFGFLARNLEQSVNLYRMKLGTDGTEEFELVVGDPTEMFPAGGIVCDQSGFGDHENQYFWNSRVYDGKLFLGTFDTSSLLQPLGQFVNGDFLRMSPAELQRQIAYLQELQRIMDSKDEVDDETSAAVAEANSLVVSLADTLDEQDPESFLERLGRIEQIISDPTLSIPVKLLRVYRAIEQSVDAEEMADFQICMGYLATATRGFGMYTLESNNGELTLETLTRNGFGDPFNHGCRVFASNDEQGWMVVGTANPFMGTQLWRNVLPPCDGTAASGCPSTAFTDLDTSRYYHEPVDYMLKHDLMHGYGNGTFKPGDNITRAEFVQILFNMEGKPAAETESAFTDVTAGKWYYNAVVWAVENGIVNGVSADTFAPNKKITREQMAAILCRYASYKGMDVSAEADLSGYTDAGDISRYAVASMQWAVGEGIIRGRTATTIAPKGNATRAEAATVLYRFIP